MNESNLKLIIKIENDAPTGIVKTIYEKSDGFFIEKVEYKGQVEWIEMNHMVEIYDKDRDWLFQEAFHAITAIKYGFKVPCGFNYFGGLNQYKNLTCDPTRLKLIETLSDTGCIGYHKIEKICQCLNCKQMWKIIEVYDSHKGTHYDCFKWSE